MNSPIVLDNPATSHEVWNEREREAWRIPKPIRPSEWAEKYRYLFKSSIPGPYRNANAPYLRGIMDISSRPGCVQVNIMKAAQIGVSEAGRNLLGYWAHMDPDPVGLTLPDRIKGRKIIKSDILPLFKQTPVLRKRLDSEARDALIETISLNNGFQLDLMWSGSATSTASNPERRIINDEVDKFKPWAGDEPDPVARTWKRMRTYGDRRLQFNISTPTTTSGQIHKLCEGSTVQLYFYVPCPHCGKFQRLVFPHLKWGTYREAENKSELVKLIIRDGSAWYECEHCHERIIEDQKAFVVRQGYWSSETGRVIDADSIMHQNAEEVEHWPTGTRIAMQISALYCLWESWAEVAAEFLLAEGDLEKSINFRTETLGEPFEYQISRVESNVFSQKSIHAALPAGLVPKWAWLLLATIDTQIDHFYAVIRAWGSGRKSQRIWHGRLMTFEELDKLIFMTSWPVEDNVSAPMLPALALIDSGGTEDKVLGVTRTMQVYEWVVPRQGIVRTIKGASRPGPGLYWPMKNPLGKSATRKAPEDLRAWMVDTHHCNDLLADLILQGVPKEKDRSRGEPPLPEIWLLNQDNDEEYNHHLAAVHKTADRTGAKIIEKWKPVHRGSRLDYRDCEAYQVAAAYMANVHLLPPEEELIQMRAQDTKQREQQKKQNQERRSGMEAWIPQPFKQENE